MSYNDPVRLFLKGDRVVAARYVRTARVMLFNLMRASAGAGVTQGRRRLRLGGNVVIEVLHAGMQGAIVITAGEEARADVKIEEQFVTWARTLDLPAGIDAMYPQLMHSIKAGAWRTLFYSDAIAGYDDFSGAKGTYRTEGGEEVFPNGIRHAGNIDWRSRDGLRVSWSGPSSRYFYDPYVQPMIQYGKKVYMFGQVLLDVDQYIIDSAPDAPFDERYVLGAALQGMTHLLVVHADLPVFFTPPQEVPPGTSIIYPPITNDVNPVSVPVTLCRYEITATPDDPTKFSVVPLSRVQLTSFPLDNALNPWFFNESATLAVSALPPSDVTWSVQQGATEPLKPPQATGTICTLSNTGSLISHTVSLSPGGRAAIAADFKGDTMVEMALERSFNNDSSDIVSLVMGNRSWVLSREILNGTVNNQTITFGRPIYADLREDTLLLFEYSITAALSGGTWTVTPHYQRMGLYCGDNVIYEESDFDIEFNSGLPRTIADSVRSPQQVRATLTVAPQFFLYEVRQTVQGGLLVLLRFQGLIGSYAYLARPPEQYFGGYSVFDGSAPRPLVMVSESSSAQAPLDENVDFDGQTNIVGCAAFEGVAMASTYAPRAPLGAAANIVVSPDVQTTLPQLTGVSGPLERYHPIWLLGALPRQEV